MSKKWILGLIIVVCAGVASSVKAQSVLNYRYDVLRYSLEYPSYDPVSLVMPGVSEATGFGAYQENPAVMAFFEEGFFSFDLSTRIVNESATYLGNTSDFSDTQTNIGNVGFVFKVPTIQGSLVVGGGYSQTTDFNRAFSVGGFNNQSTITDLYASLPREDPAFPDAMTLNEAAFQAFAIEDVTADSSVSIFRVGFPFSAYPGINQDVETVEGGRLGEYSAFFATELLKNLSVGASVGYVTGTYSFRRELLESDRRGLYDGQFIDSDGDGDFDTDIDNILSSSIIKHEISAFSAKLGFVYELLSYVNIGASYEFPTRLHITENHDTEIITTFDNGTQTEPQVALSGYRYEVVSPQRLKAGFTLKSSNGLKLSASAEAVQYSDASIEFSSLDDNAQERNINAAIRSDFKDVINLRAGLEFEVNDQFIPRVGYAYFPSPQQDVGSARQFISGGFSAEITEGLALDIGLQYSFWEDQNVLYSTPYTSETVQEDVSRIHLMYGIKMAL